jgi:hypothetical protein
MQAYDQYKIGVDGELIHLESCEENRQAAISMAQQCRRYLDICSRLLDPPVFNSPEFINALRELISEKRRPHIRVLVFDPETIVKNGHRLVELAGAFSSFIGLRKASVEFSNYNECLLLVDQTAYLHRQSASRYEATANFNDRRQSNYYLRQFDIMWDTGTPDINLRRVSL